MHSGMSKQHHPRASGDVVWFYLLVVLGGQLKDIWMGDTGVFGSVRSGSKSGIFMLV